MITDQSKDKSISTRSIRKNENQIEIPLEIPV